MNGMLNVLTDRQITALVSAPDSRTRLGKRDSALLHVLAYGGLRIAEACGLKRGEVEVMDGRTRLTFAGKGSRVRTVSLPPPAVEALACWLKMHRSPYVFPGRGGPLSTRAGRDVMMLWAEKVGLPGWVHPHSLRHSYGSKLMRSTGDLFLVSRVLGHANVNTTSKYYLSYDASYADRAAKVFERGNGL